MYMQKVDHPWPVIGAVILLLSSTSCFIDHQYSNAPHTASRKTVRIYCQESAVSKSAFEENLVCWNVEVQLHTSLNSTLNRSEWSVSFPGAVYPDPCTHCLGSWFAPTVSVWTWGEEIFRSRLLAHADLSLSHRRLQLVLTLGELFPAACLR